MSLREALKQARAAEAAAQAQVCGRQEYSTWF